MHEYERSARIHACGTLLLQISVIDAYQKLAFRKWVVDQTKASWSPDGLYIEGWMAPPTGGSQLRWADDDDDGAEITEQEELDVAWRSMMRS
eukprot:533778-Rhodomonas_salina.1